MPAENNLSATEALNRSIAEVQRLVANVGPATAVGMTLTMVKRCLQKIEQGLRADRDDWLGVAAAVKRAEGGR